MQVLGRTEMRLQHTIISMCISLCILRVPVFMWQCPPPRPHHLSIYFKNKKSSWASAELPSPPVFHSYSSGNGGPRKTSLSRSQEQVRTPTPRLPLRLLSAQVGGVYPEHTPTRCCVCVCRRPEGKAHQAARCAELKAAGGSGLPAPGSRLVWRVIWPAHRPRRSAHRR